VVREALTVDLDCPSTAPVLVAASFHTFPVPWLSFRDRCRRRCLWCRHVSQPSTDRIDVNSARNRWVAVVCLIVCGPTRFVRSSARRSRTIRKCRVTMSCTPNLVIGCAVRLRNTRSASLRPLTSLLQSCSCGCPQWTDSHLNYPYRATARMIAFCRWGRAA
jgi:hypothetical protein